MSIPRAPFLPSDLPFGWELVVNEHLLEPGCVNIVCSQDGSVLIICLSMCVSAGWKSIAPLTDGWEGSNHNAAENLLILWARALQAKENPNENKQPLG